MPLGGPPPWYIYVGWLTVLLFVTEELTKNQLFYNIPYVAYICIMFQTSFAQ